MPRWANTPPSKADRSETWMTQLRHKPWASFDYYESSKNPEGIGSVSNNYRSSQKSTFCASISSTIRAVILIKIDHHVSYNCFNEPFAVSPCKDLYWDMHGLIFETSIWLLAGSTRFYQKSRCPPTQMVRFTPAQPQHVKRVWTHCIETFQQALESYKLDSLMRRRPQSRSRQLHPRRLHRDY